MKKIFLPLLLAFTLISCDKMMSPSECQEEYDKIMADFYNHVATLSTFSPTYRNNYNSAVDNANQRAHELDECMGWQNLAKLP